MLTGESLWSIVDIVAHTDENGVFVLEDVPKMPGGTQLTLTYADYAKTTFYYNPAKPLPLLVMQPGAVIRVHITLPQGRLAEGFKLMLEGYTDGVPNTCGIREIAVGIEGYVAQYGETDDRGYCKFKKLLP